MANKTKNSKLNGKMKRRMRKTTAVVLLITSIVIAAIPVPDVTAAAESDYETNINEPENYDGYHVTEDLTTTYSIVPEVTGDDLIFCSQDGKFQFAYVENVTGTTNVGVLVGYAGGEYLDDSTLVIPEMMDAFIPYTSENGTDKGNVAVTAEGHALYYRLITENVAVYDNSDNSYSVAGKSPLSITKSPERVMKDVDNNNFNTQKLDLPENQMEVTYYTYRYKPCLNNTIDNWNFSDVNLYTHIDSDGKDARTNSEQIYCNDVDFTNGTTIKNGTTESFSSGDQTRLENAKIVYISSSIKITTDENGKWKAVDPAPDDIPSSGIFANKSYLKSVVIPDDIIGIGKYAFYGCTNLVDVNFKSLISVLGESAFENCTSLSSVYIDTNSSIQYIGPKAFKNCKSLNSFTFCVSNIFVGDEAFEGCISLNNVDFTRALNLEQFGCDVFRNCTNLKEVTLPSSLTNIGKGTFKGCTSLKNVIFPSEYSSEIPISIFQGDESLEFIRIPNKISCTVKGEIDGPYKYGIKSFIADVGDEFYFEGYKSSPIHNTSRDNEIAFSFLDDNLLGQYEKVIHNGDDKYTYLVSKDNELLDIVIEGNSSGKNIQIPEKVGPHSIKKIGSQFQGNDKIESITIPTTLEEIDNEAFKGCNNLTEVTFSEPNNLTYIGTDAFKTTSDELTFWGEISATSLPFQYAMSRGNTFTTDNQVAQYIDFCSGYPTYLHAKYNPDKGKAELTNIPKVTDQSFEENVTKALDNTTLGIGFNDAINAYNKVDGYDSIVLPSSVYSVIDAAYNIVIPTGVQCFADGLFSDASKDTTSLKTTDGLNGKNIVENANKDTGFTANGDIKSITMHDVDEVPSYAFYGCDQLEKVIMYPSNSSSGETIGSYAFGQCDSLTNVTLPMTTSTVGLRPFAGDKKLTDVKFTNDVVEGVVPGTTSNGYNFSYDNGILYALSGEGKDKVVECLEARGNNVSSGGSSVGSTTINKAELEGITEFYDEAFMDCDGIGTVDMSLADVKEIPKFCFANSEKLSYVTVNNGCEEIGEYAFKDVPLRSIQIPSTVSLIDSSAFYSTKPDDHYVTNSVEVVTSEGSVAERLALSNSKYYWSLGESINPVFTVKFVDMDGKTLIDTQTVEAGEDAEDPSEKEDITMPEHEGYYFKGWDRDFTNVGMDMWVQAVYEETPDQTWTVNFYNWNMDLIVSRTVPDGGDAEEPKTPSRTGYKFTGWSKPFTNVSEDIDTMALFDYDTSGSSSGSGSGSASSNNGSSSSSSSSEKTYTVTVINGSGSGSYVKGATVIVSAYAPNSGYQFYNWTASSSSVSFTSTTLSATSFKMPDKDVTITANYITTSVSGNSVSNNRTAGTVTSSSSSNKGSTNGNAQQTSSTDGTKVEVSKNGISDKDIASASVNGSTDNFVVKVTESASATEAVAKALKNEYTTLDNIKYFAMDISLYDETGKNEVTDTSGLSVTITLPIPDELRAYGGNNKVAGVVNGDRLDKLDPKFTTIDGVPCVTFTATHFSPYTIYVDTANLVEGVSDATPKTGDAIHPKWFLAVGLFCLSIVLFLKRDKKYQVEYVR